MYRNTTRKLIGLPVILLVMIAFTGCFSAQGNQVAPVHTEPTVTEPVEGLTKENEDGYIAYIRWDGIQTKKRETAMYYRLFILSPEKGDMERLYRDIDPFSIAWRNDGQVLALGSSSMNQVYKNNNLYFWDFTEPLFYREEPFASSAIRLSNDPYAAVDLSPECKAIIGMAWQQDQKEMNLVCDNGTSEARDYQYCQLTLNMNKGNLPVGVEKKSCKKFEEQFNLANKKFISFQNSPVNQDILIVTWDQEERYQTYLYRFETNHLEPLFSGAGMAWSPDGARIASAQIPDHKGCLVEFTLSTKTFTDVYCPLPAMDETSALQSLFIKNNGASYSPDGRYLLFTASRNYYSMEPQAFALYRINLETKASDLLSPFWDGDAYNPIWQPKK